ncbi:MAG TPA: bifunctional oligoribonuclease/PAP phosphatase NrnA [Bacillota bacterium]|nr:bifunctional oligoribonuclease/PAP phosphatase NrnA [Bacillota bacterium]
MKLITPEECAARLKELSGSITVLTHANPDGDTVGSACALVRILRALGKDVYAFCPDPIPFRYMFLLEDGLFVRTLPDAKQTFVAVDIPSSAQLGKDAKTFDRKIHILIDHHISNTLDADYKLVMSEKSAAGEIVYILMGLLGGKPDVPTAEALYAAIASDSGGFRFSSTSPQTHETAAALLETGIDFAKINRFIFDTITDGEFKIAKLAYSILEKRCCGRVAVLCFTNGMLADAGIEKPEYGDTVQLGRRLEGVEVGITLKPDGDNSFRVSLRSNEYVNVSEIAQAFGGGGHYFAAACRIDGSPEDAVNAVVAETEKRLEKLDNTY